MFALFEVKYLSYLYILFLFQKFLILLCCIHYGYASHHHSHTIPVEGYETKLEDLGQHVEIPETPVKVIKITKTIAIKVPVPYPVKVIQKVPYPVHISKPYPVHVPQIVHVPAPTHKYGGHDHTSNQGNEQAGLYQVQEGSHEPDGYSGPAQEQSYDGGNSGHNQNTESLAEEYPSQGSYGGSSYDAPSHSYYGNSGNQDHEGSSNSLDSKNYDQAIQDYLNKINPSSGSPSSGASGYYH